MSQRFRDLPPGLFPTSGSPGVDQGENSGEVGALQAMIDILRKPDGVRCPHCWGRGSAYDGECCTYCYGSGRVESKSR